MNYPIVILHGWGLSGKKFAPLVAELKKQHIEVYAPDFPGFDSKSIPQKPLTLDDYARFLSVYLKEKRISKPILVGHSFGGRVALRYQKLYPHEAQALVLTGTPGFTPIAKKKLQLFIAMAKIGGFIFSLPVIRIFEHQVRLWYYYVVGARDYYRAEGAMRETFKNIIKEELLSSMQSIRVPTLLVWGEDDIIIPTQIARRMKEVIKNADLVVIPHADHGVPYKNPKKFVSAVLRWVETV